MDGTPLRPAMVAGAVAAVVLAVAVAAAGAATGLADPDTGDADDAVSLSLVVSGAAVVALAALAIRWWAGRPERTPIQRRPVPWWIWRVAVVMLVQTLLAGAVLAGLALTGESSSEETRPPLESTEPPQRPPASETAREAVDWPLAVGAVLAVVGLVGVVASVLVLRSRRVPEDPVAPEESLAEAVAASVADLDDLADDPDHRRAVIRAYTRMERALGRSGIPRRPPEAPFEYLERALGQLGVGSVPAHHLTELFERARFSIAPVTVDMRRSAADALRQAQADFGVPA